ncbi:hypothetical protein SUDANB176_06815 [Streptomyces sp. enrichment culture]|uniref:hypothetical protein n=1 Tax=Streptomyces sp. enrichment culture TaxID=1795815 RepID=UPI003F57A1D5
MRARPVGATAVEALLTAAVAAPSIRTAQPWRFGMDTDTGTVEVRADRRRVLPFADPEARAQHLSVGAADRAVRHAAGTVGPRRADGLFPVVAEEFPDHVAVPLGERDRGARVRDGTRLVP